MFSEDGSWLKPPPSYPPIAGPGSQSSHNLEDFTRMEEDNSEYGPVLSLTEFVRKFHLNNWDTSIPLIIVTIFKENTILKWYFINPRRDLQLYFPSCGELLLLTIISFYDCQTLILTIFSRGTIIDQILEKNTLKPPCIVKIKILKNLFYHFKIQIDKIAKRILWIFSLSLYC